MPWGRVLRVVEGMEVRLNPMAASRQLSPPASQRPRLRIAWTRLFKGELLLVCNCQHLSTSQPQTITISWQR